MALNNAEKTQIREFLINQFQLGELKNLAADIGVDFELFSHGTKPDFALAFIQYLERHQIFSCLVSRLLEFEIRFQTLLRKLPPCPPSNKYEVDSTRLQDTPIVEDELREAISKELRIPSDKITIVVLVQDSGNNVKALISVLDKSLESEAPISLPSVALEEEPTLLRDGTSDSEPELETSKYRINSITPYDSLDSTSQLAWKLIARDAPPLRRNKEIESTITWQEAIQTSTVLFLEQLTDYLYPEPMSPDIISLNDFTRRYRLTKLGKPGIQAIEQSQRIIRETGDFDDIGLCKFHTGLIYLYWGDCRGAIQQFESARQQWSYISKTSSVTLAYLAEGIAQHRIFAHEKALGHYRKAQQMLSRIHLEPSPTSRGVFVDELNKALVKARQVVRDELWIAEETDKQLPTSKKEIKTESESKSKPSSEPAKKVAPPIFPDKQEDELDSPIPAHKTTNSQLTWYQVHIQRPDPLFADIKDLGWLLVYQPTIEARYKKGDLIVVANENLDTKASIILEPLLPEGQVFPRICLARAELELDFTNDEEGKVQFATEIRQIPVASQHILGHVLGLWLEIGESGILES